MIVSYILLARCSDVQHILNEIDETLKQLVDEKGLFDGYGSLDIGVWKKQNGKISTIYEKAYGLAQYKSLKSSLPNIKGKILFDSIEEAVESLEDLPNVPALNSGRRNLYRIASNTKMFVGVAALMMNKKYGLNLDEKVSLFYHGLLNKTT